jgi:APA family basic amino acid/polyamine antiporter
MSHLAKRLRAVDYFTLGFGTMVGVGWLVVMDDWLQRGGPLGGVLGFVIGGAILLPIGWVYGRLVVAVPDAASEIAYAERCFSQAVSFGTGWMMMLAYFVVCPWEAVAIGKLCAYIFPQMDSIQLYHLGGQNVYLPHVILGMSLTVIITAINYHGIRMSATFQNWTTFGLLLLFAVFATAGLARGSVHNLAPAFSHGGALSIWLVLQITPYFMAGFETVPKCVEEAKAGFRTSDFSRAIAAAIVVGIFFYASVIAVVSYVYPWQLLTKEKFATAFAFEHALKSHWVVQVILLAALLSLLKAFNGSFVAATRVLFALGRRGLIDTRMARVHEINKTPAAAILGIGILTAAALFMGSAILIPIAEVGSMAFAVGWLVTCAAYFTMEPRYGKRVISGVGILVAIFLIAMKILPFLPGHFSRYEWIALIAWIMVGVVLKRKGHPLPVARGRYRTD